MKIKQIVKNKIKYYPKGVSIIEALVLIFIFSVVTMSFYSVFAVGTKYILNSKNKIIAISLANERMEMLRNLAYDNVAVVGGIPNGLIDPDENVAVGDKTFHVITDITYKDDPDDGVALGSPLDNVPTDYKTAKIIVKWGEETEGERATLVSRFVPPGVETSVGGGTFSINSIDYAGNPVSNVNINIFNDQVSPIVNYSTTMDSNGNLLLQGVPSDLVQNYKITMSKAGYETVVTYSPLTAGFIPEDAHNNIIEGVLNEKTIIIDLLSDIAISSKDSLGDDLPNVTFDIYGGRRLDDGTVDPSISLGTFSYTDTITTDGDGEFSDNDVNAGKYTLGGFTFASGDYQFRKVDLGSDSDPAVFDVVAGTAFNTNVIFMDKNLDSAYICIKDSVSAAVVAGAEVKLRNTTLGYETTILTTDKYGYVYFPEAIATPLQNGETYEVLVSATNYQDKTDSIVINKFTDRTVNLDSI
ncbi:MAG: hypothetical protein ACD_7C00312G0011 [uncultured bacterium]|nr:MAG: hypothetical protein ACD_7C00312G0011 [uncultured bacterium]KKP68064.1 MAG: hypothetical protein UR66_C0009G0154 [Candidatus Moranbacteria bacterium GW2011_GWE1_35_17]KKP72999.1 MAG: hypothetical protein UR65_C0009G0003 [Candidatus Moranbacteria bacterium GW2011_GWE2_35_164]KKP84719.1 MAG: hypothetical protein UR83_C0014G0022 [Candidatus Moranbacteria bacterium GW2011_GWF2_35_54]HBR79306.1 hypothetical protein [Candidatus Moranbacteria bacterium]